VRLAPSLLAVLIAAPLTARAERGGSVPAMMGTSRSAEVVQPGAEPVVPPEPAPAPVIDPLAGAPRPEDAGGVVVPRERPAPRPWLRAALFIPRVVVAAAVAPVRFALWAEDEHQVSARTQDLFWNDERTIGLYPTVSWDLGRNVSGGGVFVHQDLAGAALRVRATAGTVERYHLAGSARVRVGPAGIELSGRYRETAGEGYFGIGDTLAEVSRYGLDETTVKAGALWWVADGVTLGLGGSIRRLSFRERAGVLDDPDIGELHDVTTIPFFESGVEATRGEVSVLVDRRRPRHRYQSAAAPSTGWAAQAFAGWQHDLEQRTGFGYGGADLARSIDLFGGDRVLTLRATVDGVLGDRDDVPFVDLPTIGGAELLRGYSTAQFRDRWAATASAEYMYPVTDGVAAFVFTDAGRVAAAPEDLADEAPRVGFGMGLQAHSRSSLLARLSVASSIDGGVIANLRVDPVFRARGREVVR
jgi:hypothetical protein